MIRLFALVGTLAFAGCAHVPTPEVPAGPQAQGPPSDADAQLQAADALRAEGDHVAASKAYRDLATRFQDSADAPRALWRGGQEAEAAGQAPIARAAYADLVARFPLDGRAEEARRRMAELDLRQKHYGDAEQTLRSLYDRTPDADRPKAARSLAEAAAGAGDFPEAVRWWSRLLATTPDPALRQLAQGELDRILDTRLSALDAAKLLQELPADSPILPSLAAKRALVLEHLGDPSAKGALEDFLRRYPQSPLAPRLRERLLSLERAARVEPGLVGVLLPQSPARFAAYGAAALQGLQLGIGPGVRLLVKDTQGDPATATAAVEALAEAGAQIIVGPILSGEAEAAAAAAERVGIPIVTLARTEGLTAMGPFVFRNMLTDSAQARAIVHYAADVRGMKRFAVLYPEVEYGRQMMNLFWDQVDQAKGEVRGAEAYPFDSTTFKQYAEKLVGRHDLELREDWLQGVRDLKEKKLTPLQKKRALRQLREGLEAVVDFDAIFIADSAKSVSLIAPALAVENIVTNGCDKGEMRRLEKTTGQTEVHPVELLGWTAWYDPDFDLVQRAGHYVECSVFVDGFFAQSARPETRGFVQAFQHAYGREPGLMEAEAYDSGRMISGILAAHPATREAVRDSLAALKDFPGATGKTSIGPDREPVKDLFYLTITSKGYEELDLSKVTPIQAPGGS